MKQDTKCIMSSVKGCDALYAAETTMLSFLTEHLLDNKIMLKLFEYSLKVKCQNKLTSFG